jgi:hypothetical protein
VYVLETPIYRQKYCLVSKFGPSTFFFCKFWFCLIFLYFLETSNINVDSMKKINDFKNDAWKVVRVRKTFENLNSFLDDAKNAKNDANILKIYFFGFSLFFAIFEFQKFLSKR